MPAGARPARRLGGEASLCRAPSFSTGWWWRDRSGVLDRCLPPPPLQAGPRALGMEAFNVNASHHGGVVGCASCSHA